jgi:hypothetical protein
VLRNASEKPMIDPPCASVREEATGHPLADTWEKLLFFSHDAARGHTRSGPGMERE